jgi:hypothetical protein
MPPDDRVIPGGVGKVSGANIFSGSGGAACAVDKTRLTAQTIPASANFISALTYGQPSE